MDEKRQFFRIKNDGDILASCDEHPLDVIEISSKGIAIIKENNHIHKVGTLDLHIHGASLKVAFELLRVENQTMVLIFPRREDIEKLFILLKGVKDEHK